MLAEREGRREKEMYLFARTSYLTQRRLAARRGKREREAEQRRRAMRKIMNIARA